MIQKGDTRAGRLLVSLTLAGVTLALLWVELPRVQAEGQAGLPSAEVSDRGAQRRRGVTEAYRRRRTLWHKRAPRRFVRAWAAQQPSPLVIRSVSSTERYTLVPNAQGQFDEAAQQLARGAFAWRRDQSTRTIHPRLLELMYRAVLEFNAPYVWIVSGFRGRRPTSRHYQGRAADIVLPGVRDRRLAHFLRRQGFVGVGVYPVSGFVHLDIRAQSYFWNDHSGPGQSQRNRPTAFGAARRFDRAARARGEVSVPDLSAEESEAEMRGCIHRPAPEGGESAESDAAPHGSP